MRSEVSAPWAVPLSPVQRRQGRRELPNEFQGELRPPPSAKDFREKAPGNLGRHERDAAAVEQSHAADV